MTSMEDNDLLAELNGVAATPEEAKELAAAEKELKTDPLEVKPKKAKSAAARATEKAKTEAAAKGAAVRGYAITVEGKYTVACTDVPGKKRDERYSLVVNVPELEGALSLIKNKLLDKMLRMKYPGYITYLTHEIVGSKPLTTDTPPAANVAYMNLDDLRSHATRERMPIAVDQYGDDVKALRAAVVDYILNPKGFEEREKVRLASVLEDKALSALNDVPPSAD
jgi:hypothetical protein